MPLNVLVQPFVTDAPGGTQGIDVAIAVLNDSSDFALLQESSCGWMAHYRIDAPGVGIQMPSCKSNFITIKRLAPGRKVFHERVHLDPHKPLPIRFVFRVGLVQPKFALPPDEVLRRAHMSAYEGLLYTGREFTFWSDPVVMRARTRWFDWEDYYRAADKARTRH